MKAINLLACWFYGVDNEEFKRFLDVMNVQKCHCLYIDKESPVDERIIMLNISNPLSYYKNANISIELDDTIVDLMKPYEQTCMDLINRWRLSYTEKSDYQEIKRIYFILLRYWNDYIIRHKINLMVINTIPHAVDEFIPYAICKAYSIPTIVQGIVPFTKGEKTNYILRPSTDEFDLHLQERYHFAMEKYENTNEEIPLNPEIRRYFYQYDENLKEDKKVVFYNEKKSILDKFIDYKNRALKYMKRGERGIVLNKIKYLCKVRLETSRFLKQVEKLEEVADLNKDFILFCLHLQPEATTTPAGGNYADQLMAIRLISSSLPNNLFLYVKEHPAYWAQKNRVESIYESRNIDFYQEIKRLRNVVLVDHAISSAALMEKAKGIVTITGTVGFEAIFKGIPVITFAGTFYESYPSVFRVREQKDCKSAIDSIIHNTYQYNKRSVEIFLCAVQKYVVPLGMFEKNFLDNGAPGVSGEDRVALTEKIVEFYKEYYENEK